jgi:hypothetical protein
MRPLKWIRMAPGLYSAYSETGTAIDRRAMFIIHLGDDWLVCMGDGLKLKSKALAARTYEEAKLLAHEHLQFSSLFRAFPIKVKNIANAKRIK